MPLPINIKIHALINQLILKLAKLIDRNKKIKSPLLIFCYNIESIRNEGGILNHHFQVASPKNNMDQLRKHSSLHKKKAHPALEAENLLGFKPHLLNNHLSIK